ncbi:hypothetical protein BDR07DRAFT_1424814 [Suillus spraguei]|nr:hypothetical protein BDR07DRAFT_1424814 [Suillus spraguei]
MRPLTSPSSITIIGCDSWIVSLQRNRTPVALLLRDQSNRELIALGKLGLSTFQDLSFLARYHDVGAQTQLASFVDTSMTLCAFFLLMFLYYLSTCLVLNGDDDCH